MTGPNPMRRDDRVAAVFLAACGIALFGWLAPNAGLHLDDHGFWWDFQHARPGDLWNLFVQYVPGRNLYIPLYYALHRLSGGSAPAMHVFGLLLDLLNPLLLYALARRLGAGAGGALAAAGLFLVWPNHAETHWWTSSIMMNLFSTTLALAAFLAAGTTSLSRTARLSLAAALYLTALFDYDQVFFLWLPLLAYAAWADPGFPRRSLAGAAALFLACDVLHTTARLFWPWSSGGRPVPRGDVLLLSLKHALTQSFAPMRRLPVLDGFPGGPAAALLVSAALGAAWVWLCARRWRRDEGRVEKRLLLFGAAWWTFAYLPNLFWYISPRHNYLPSAGLCLAAAAFASRLSAAPRARRPVAALAAALFALFSLSAWSEGMSWAASTALHKRFADEAAPLLPTRPAAVFLLGAPKNIGQAPGFFQPREHIDVLGRTMGRRPDMGDVSVAVNRRGLFFGGQMELFGDAAAPWFVPLSSATMFTAHGGRFRRACAVRLDTPGLPVRYARLADACPDTFAIRPAVALVSSRVLGRAADAPDAPLLESAVLETGPGRTLDLILRWRAGAEPADFAAHARLLAEDGRTLYRSSYQPSPQEHEAFWPLYDDEHPASAWKPGERVEQRHRLRLPRPLTTKPSLVRLSLFLRREGVQWTPLGTRETTLEVR